MKKNVILIIGVILLIILIAVIVIVINKSNFGNKDDIKIYENVNTEKSTDELNNTTKQKTFLYTDDAGRVRYKLVINGNEVITNNYPFKLNESDKGSYYPIKDILKYFNVETLSSEDNSILTTKINGSIVKVDANNTQMSYGKTTFKAVDSSIKTVLVDGVLYVPSFFFMQLTNSSIVDYSSDGTSATLTTDLAVNSKTSGITGLKISTTNANTTNGGYRYCTKCGGAGGYNEMYMDQYLSSNGQYKQVSKYRWRSCPVCGGSGHVK